MNNTDFENYRETIIYGKPVLATKDGNTTFPFETQEEKEQTLKYFNKDKNNE